SVHQVGQFVPASLDQFAPAKPGHIKPANLDQFDRRMHLTGIALAIGVIVDNGIIMSENAYKHLAERYAIWEKNKKSKIV
ncbi:hypothetical protein, partial [Paracnuella aquatica]|uniref:hypothetical protein n=1 Tax=Paracnuella aquatica TaxID=2268757 RepID=UPI0019D45D3C